MDSLSSKQDGLRKLFRLSIFTDDKFVLFAMSVLNAIIDLGWCGKQFRSMFL